MATRKRKKDEAPLFGINESIPVSKPKPPNFDFDEFRKGGPWFRVGSLTRAKRRWHATVTSEADLAAIQAAKEEYRLDAAIAMRAERKKGASDLEARRFVMHLSTFMGRWQSYVPEERTETLTDETPQVIDESELRAQAERTYELLQKVLLNFLADKAAHKPTLKCRESKVCRLCHAEQKPIPTVDELMEKLRNER